MTTDTTREHHRWAAAVPVALQGFPLVAFLIPLEVEAALNPPFNAAADALAIATGLTIAGGAGQLFLLCSGLGYAYLSRRVRWAIALLLGTAIWAMGFVVGLVVSPMLLDVPVGWSAYGTLVALLVAVTAIDAGRLALRHALRPS